MLYFTQEWKKARYIKIELYDMPMPLGFEGDMFVSKVEPLYMDTLETKKNVGF